MRAAVMYRIATAVALVAACHSAWAEVSGPMRSLPLSVLTSDPVRERLDSIQVQTAGIIRGPLLSFGCGEWRFDWFGRDGRPIPGLGEKVRALYRQAGCQMTPEGSDSASFVREHYVGPASEFVPAPFLTRYRGVAHNQGRLHADDYAAIPPGAERVALMSVCRWKGECKEALVVSFSAISNEELREVALEEAVFRVLDYRRDNVVSPPHRSMEERTATVIEARDLDIRLDNTGLGAKIGAVGGTHTGWHAGSHSGGTSGGLAGGLVGAIIGGLVLDGIEAAASRQQVTHVTYKVDGIDDVLSLVQHFEEPVGSGDLLKLIRGSFFTRATKVAR